MAVDSGRKELAAILAKTAVTTTLAGPLAGGGVIAEAAIRSIASRLFGRARSAYDEVVKVVTPPLQAWADSENIGDEQVEAGLRGATDVIAKFGLDARGMARHALQADVIADAVLAAAEGDLALMEEAESQVCRRAVAETYARLLATQSLLSDLDFAFKQEVLKSLKAMSVSTPTTGADDLGTLSIPAPTWTPVLHAPSALLRSSYRVVPFGGRDAELEHLATWRKSELPIGVMLVTGPGGYGKTRLLLEDVIISSRGGWNAGFLSITKERRDSNWAVRLLQAKEETMAVVDYAETRVDEVADLLDAAAKGFGKFRLVLLARARSDWWDGLCRQGGYAGDLLTGPGTSTFQLQPLVQLIAARSAAVQDAARAYSAKLGTIAMDAVGSYALEDYKRVLFLHMAGLDLAIGGDTDGSPNGLLESALRREQRLWDDGLKAMSLDGLAGPPILQAAAAATLAGQFSTRRQATDFLAICPLLRGQTAAAIDDVASLLERLYPASTAFAGVEPDLLGEYLTGRALSDDPRLSEVLAYAGK